MLLRTTSLGNSPYVKILGGKYFSQAMDPKTPQEVGTLKGTKTGRRLATERVRLWIESGKRARTRKATTRTLEV